jgi:hypothetical protein
MTLSKNPDLGLTNTIPKSSRASKQNKSLQKKTSYHVDSSKELLAGPKDALIHMTDSSKHCKILFLFVATIYFEVLSYEA